MPRSKNASPNVYDRKYSGSPQRYEGSVSRGYGSPLGYEEVRSCPVSTPYPTRHLLRGQKKKIPNSQITGFHSGVSGGKRPVQTPFCLNNMAHRERPEAVHVEMGFLEELP